MSDLVLCLVLTGMFVAVLTILYVLGNPARKRVLDSHTLVAGDVIVLRAPDSGLTAAFEVTATDRLSVTLTDIHGRRSTITHAVFAARLADDGLEIWKESPDVRRP